MKYGNLSFAGATVFIYNDFNILYDNSHKSYKLQWKTFFIPEVGAEGVTHLDCLARALELSLVIAGVHTDDIKKGLARFRISGEHTKLKNKGKLESWKS